MADTRASAQGVDGGLSIMLFFLIEFILTHGHGINENK